MAEASDFLDRGLPVLIDRIGDGVIVLRMNRPDRLNAMTAGLVSELHESLDRISSDPECRVVILTGEGGGFCTGLDFAGYGLALSSSHLGTNQR